MNKKIFCFIHVVALILSLFYELAYSSEIKNTEAEGKTSDNTNEELPTGVSKRGVSEDVFGQKGGYFHPFLSITEFYSDNVFNNDKYKKSDFVTVISPGIWITVPHVREKLLYIETSNISPGGFTISRHRYEFFKRYQTYLFYNADIERFSRFKEGNTTSHKLEGFLQYNTPGGLSAEIVEQFISSHDAWGTGISRELDKYKTNLVNLVFSYNLSERFKLRADYSNFYVNYDAKRNNFRDRVDNVLAGYVFYKIKPKTSLFFEYEFMDIGYDKNILSDSLEHHYYGGLEWDITAKSIGSIKLGYGVKDFSSSYIKDNNDFIFEVRLDHKFTPKTSLILKATRRTEETNISATYYIISNSIEAEYLQRITRKIQFYLGAFYSNENYKGKVFYNNIVSKIEDDYYRLAVALQYEFREWLKADLGYIYNKRSSSLSDFDYTTNIIFLRVTASL